MAAIVRLENVSKRFVIHHEKARSFQDAVVNFFHRRNGTTEQFWALKDVSVEVQPGETLGVIGENGSGKSTILKLITRILEPTSGRVTVNGKVSALIELGAGFHPDLTGRENVYLNGSILGFSRRQMDRKLDEIVAFSELERFIDTPVKHYSSGMYARLGFSVAMSVDPDVLIIDEVLSVGDEVFQRKCLDKIDEFRRRGKTIIFVSHALPIVEQLCDRVVWLHHGVVMAGGAPADVIQQYSQELQRHDERNREQEHRARPRSESSLDAAAPDQPGVSAEMGNAAVTAVELRSAQGEERYSFRTGETAIARLHYRITNPFEQYVFSVELRRSDGLLIHRTASAPFPGAALNGTGFLEVEFPDLPLLAGTYDVAGRVWCATDPELGGRGRGTECRFSVWSDLDAAGVVVMACRWAGADPDRATLGRGKRPSARVL